MKILVTGAAGFIGSALILRLLNRGDSVMGIDNHNDYYSPALKEARLLRHKDHNNYTHARLDLANRTGMTDIFNTFRPQRVINLAAQAGVRYSIQNPYSFIDSNLVGFAHVLEGCRQNGVEHLVYASSSSVYGANNHMPYSVNDNVNHPMSLYAATKKANELMAHSYSHLYGLPTTGLRFFTVYGPWSRPDMALHKFAHAIANKQVIQVFNHGNHSRDFTYIDDIVEGVIRVLDRPAVANLAGETVKSENNNSKAPWRVYNIGSNRPVRLMDYIKALENALGQQAVKEFLPMQPGDVQDTWANMDDMVEQFNYQPTTSIEMGIANFASWYKKYYATN